MTVWKNGLESKGLKVDTEKTKVMILGNDLHTLQTSGKCSCVSMHEKCRAELNLLL